MSKLHLLWASLVWLQSSVIRVWFFNNVSIDFYKDHSFVIRIAPSTKKIFGQKIPAMSDPALAIPQNRRKIIYELKNKKNPHGTDIEGLVALPFSNPTFWHFSYSSGALHFQRLNYQNLPAEARYIHEVSSHDRVDLIITMLPFLAAHIHSAYATLHDNTYKCVFRKWKEWEVVVWDSRLNMCTWATYILLHFYQY